MPPIIVLVLCFLHLSSCNSDIGASIHEFIDKIIPYKELEAKMEETLGNSSEALIAKIMSKLKSKY